ncbi:DUF6216 family protein [Achromobacter piechaudii]|uniref:Uncharacterized protein n=1 Tax=Achromobacter piechaudii TaxID=72556 RepID=A0ABM8KS34_9BURK|nr:DUF6216 family protein [Achromobacter piechaudii]CAB3662877.1 hypothetical protein LMG1873_00685 [Achromobacter piechaudii]CAB3827039.1 hypothetical protein LMG2828_00761 [Achromobacter piechaudii]CAB3944788.1 hypothetical protein LMG6103_01006 [Achromobacter piechaudii]
MLELFNPLVQAPWIAPVLWAGLFLLLCLWIRARAGSAHFLLDRLWRIAAGRREAQDSVLKKIQQESRDLEIFRFFYRMPLQSLADLHKLDSWAKANNVGMLKLKTLWRWVDVRNSAVVRRPKKMWKPAVFLIVVVLGTFFIFAGSLLASPYGYFHMKESNVWFKTDAKTVRNMTLWGEDWAFATTECAADSPDLMEKTGFRKSELLDLCRALASGSMKDQVHSLVKQQRLLALLLILPTLVGLAIVIRASSGAAEAEKLWKELNCEPAAPKAIEPSGTPAVNCGGTPQNVRS